LRTGLSAECCDHYLFGCAEFDASGAGCKGDHCAEGGGYAATRDVSCRGGWVESGGLSPQNCTTGVRVGVTIGFQIYFRGLFQSRSSGGSPNTSLKLV